jgi:hypothetical protein
MSLTEAVMWPVAIGLLIALVSFIASPGKKMGRGGFSVQHLLLLQSVWEPHKKYVMEQKQDAREEVDDEAGPPDPGRDRRQPRGGTRIAGSIERAGVARASSGTSIGS